MRPAPLPLPASLPIEPDLIAAALDATPDGVGITDRDGFFVYVNPAHVAEFGYADADALLGQPWTMLYDRAEADRLGGSAFPALASTGAWHGAATARRANGSYFPQEL